MNFLVGGIVLITIALVFGKAAVSLYLVKWYGASADPTISHRSVHQSRNKSLTALTDPNSSAIAR